MTTTDLAIPYRPLTSEEHSLLTWILNHGSAEAPNFLPQLRDLSARSSCVCGCPSIEFNVPLDSPFIEKPEGMRLFFDGRSGEHAVGLMLTAVNGLLSALEVYVYGENERPFGLPAIDTLSVAR